MLACPAESCGQSDFSPLPSFWLLIPTTYSLPTLEILYLPPALGQQNGFNTICYFLSSNTPLSEVRDSLIPDREFGKTLDINMIQSEISSQSELSTIANSVWQFTNIISIATCSKSIHKTIGRDNTVHRLR